MASSNMKIQVACQDIQQSSFTKQDKYFPISTEEPKNVLCKISFDIDQKQEHLFIRQDTTLDQIADQLITIIAGYNSIENNQQQDITDDQKILLKQEIKSKIQAIIQQNTQKTFQADIWRNKLKDIIQTTTQSRTPMDSLLPSSTRNKKNQDNPTKSVTYFGYRPFQSMCAQYQQNYSLKNKENYQKIKKIHKEFIQPRSLSHLENVKSRLYDLGKNNQIQKNYNSKMHQWFSVQKQLSQCTFHPQIRKIKKNDFSQSNAKNKNIDNVFNRLYHGAQEKQQKMKKIQKQISQRQQEEFDHLDFIPKIDECSKQIAKIKKQYSFAKQSSIHQHLYQQNKIRRKIFQKPSDCTFHPEICRKSQKIAKKSKNIQPMHNSQEKNTNHIDKDKKHNLIKTNKLFSDKNKKQINTENNHQDSQFKALNKDKTMKAIKNRFLTQKSLNFCQPFVQQDKLISSNAKKQQSTHKKQTIKKVNYSQSQPFLKKTLPTVQFQRQIKLQKKQKYKDFKKKKYHNLQQKEKVQFNDLQNIKIQQYVIQGQAGTQNQKQKWILTQDTINKTESSDFMINSQPKRDKKLKNPFQFFKMQQKSIKSTKNQANNQQFQKSILKNTSRIDELFQQRKSLIFESIFDFLKAQFSTANQISYLSIMNNSLVSQKILKILHPMAQQMRQLNVGLDKEEFIWSISRIFQNLSLRERGSLLAWGLKLQPEQIKSIR